MEWNSGVGFFFPFPSFVALFSFASAFALFSAVVGLLIGSRDVGSFRLFWSLEWYDWGAVVGLFVFLILCWGEGEVSDVDFWVWLSSRRDVRGGCKTFRKRREGRGVERGV